MLATINPVLSSTPPLLICNEYGSLFFHHRATIALRKKEFFLSFAVQISAKISA